MYDQYAYNTETSNIDAINTDDLFNTSCLEMDSVQAIFDDMDNATIAQLQATGFSDEDLGNFTEFE